MGKYYYTNNKKKILIKILLATSIIFPILLTYTPKKFNIHAEDVDSSSYKIKDFTLGSGGGEDQTATNYRVLLSVGDAVNDERLASTSYKLGMGTAVNWMATAPSIKCFETTTEGSTSCDDADVTPDGMVMLCGDGGCFDRARFELNAEGNPSDTLYSIRITTDVAWSSWDYIDGSTFMIETSSSHDINDYLTESSWEGTGSSINVLGLDYNTTYYLRATALHGDFTESDPGPDANATTGNPEVTFDIDIDGTGGGSSETSAPYSIALGLLTVGSVKTATDLIWMDLGSNAPNGSYIIVEDDYTGLYSSIGSYTISSATEDLDVDSEGYGLQEYSSSESYLGPLSVESDFGSSGNSVGGISTSPKKIYNTSSNPIYSGRAGVYVKSKASISAPPETDYQDEITFVAVGTY